LSGGAGSPNPLQRTGDSSDALGDLIRRNACEREAQARPSALEHEVRPRDERDLLLERSGEQLGCVHVLAEREPQEVAASGNDELGLRDVLSQGRDERVPALSKSPLDELDVPVEIGRASCRERV